MNGARASVRGCSVRSFSTDGGPKFTRTGFSASAAALVAGTLSTTPGLAQNIVFHDATIEAGVDYLQWDGILPPDSAGGLARDYYYMMGAAAAGDYDNDGDPDLYCTLVHQPNRLFRNNGDGTFTDVAATAGVDLNNRGAGAAWGDVNNDGWLDLYVMTFKSTDRNYLYLNQGNGSFQEAALAYQVDLATVNNHYFSSAGFGDYDLDGDVDLLVLNWLRINKLLRNDGDVFSRVNNEIGLNLRLARGFAGSFADINNDGWPDLQVAADFGTSRLHVNRGATFEDTTVASSCGTDENGMGSTVADYDNDGDIDWFVTSVFDPAQTCATLSCGFGWTGNRLYRNEGGESFIDATDAAGVRDGRWGWGASFFDFDNDGWLDLAMTNGVIVPHTEMETQFNDDPLRLWWNRGPGATMLDVAESTGFVDTRSGKGLLTFDYDLDGDEDVFITNTADHPVLFRNDGGNQNSWLQVALRGRRTNAFGLGARIYVQVSSGGVTQMREIAAANNFLSQNDVVASFGLGPDVRRIHSLRVVWPASGVETTYHDVAANQRLTLTELLCPGDLDESAVVDTADLITLLRAYGQSGGVGDGDLTGDQRVGFDDLSFLLSNFGLTCE